MNGNGIVLAAPRSGSGKTTITCGIIKALTLKGYQVRAYKCGPDYIDPMFHRKVLGVNSRNLDLFFSSEEEIRDLYMLDNDSDISIVEGVMGLYDGLSGIREEASTYHLACALDKKVILILDAHGMGRSVLAEIKGFLEMDHDKRIAGVILNRVSASFYPLMKEMIEKETGIRVVGYMPKLEDVTFSSRHLGLVLPDEIADIEASLSLVAKKIDECIDLNLLMEISKESREYEQVTEKIPKKRVKIAVAMDEAFCFYYEENLRLLRKNGADLVTFSPIHDEKLPEDVSGIILGGGYPELYARALSGNLSMKKSIMDAINSGMPVLAECGGFMYLHQSITDKEGNTYKMCGAYDGECTYSGRLVRFGYIELSEKEACFDKEIGPVRIRAHEFHYYDSTNNGSAALANKPNSDRKYECSFINDKNWWGFAHLYYPSNPLFPKAFVDKCVKYCEE